MLHMIPVSKTTSSTTLTKGLNETLDYYYYYMTEVRNKILIKLKQVFRIIAINLFSGKTRDATFFLKSDRFAKVE